MNEENHKKILALYRERTLMQKKMRALQEEITAIENRITELTERTEKITTAPTITEGERWSF